jgi:hypothetical protein
MKEEHLDKVTGSSLQPYPFDSIHQGDRFSWQHECLGNIGYLT